MSDQDEDERLGARGLSSLIKMTGAEIPARARFIGGAVVTASVWSITIGMTAGAVGSVLFPLTVGPLVPYMVGSAVGYTFGLFQTWTMAKRQTIWYAQQFPPVLAHALKTGNQIIVPSSVMKASMMREEPEEDETVWVAGGYQTIVPAQNSFIGGPVTLDRWILQGGLGRLTWAILASQECRDDVAAIQRQHRQAIVERLGAIEYEDN